jgi:cobalt-zinc-cadmium efflux system outer membrane protein
MGAFDLLMAKQKELEAYQKYLEALRDYWIVRADMQRSLGGRLPAHVQSKRIPHPDPIETSTINKQDIQENETN